MLCGSFLWVHYEVLRNQPHLAGTIQWCHGDENESRLWGKIWYVCMPCPLGPINPGILSRYVRCIIHCDVEPENNVTTAKRYFYPIDWGSARYQSDPVSDCPVGNMGLRVLKGERTLYPIHKSHFSANNERRDLCFCGTWGEFRG